MPIIIRHLKLKTQKNPDGTVSRVLRPSKPIDYAQDKTRSSRTLTKPKFVK